MDNKLIYKGKVFDSIGSLAAYLGINRVTLRDRIKNGWSEEKWGLRVGKIRSIEYDGELYSSINQMYLQDISYPLYPYL